MERLSGQWVDKEALELYYTLDHMNLRTIIEHSIPKHQHSNILLKCLWNILQDISSDRTQRDLNKFKIKVISRNFSSHNCMKFEMNYKEKGKNFTTMWRFNIMLLNNQWVKEEIKEELKKNLRSSSVFFSIWPRAGGGWQGADLTCWLPLKIGPFKAGGLVTPTVLSWGRRH